MNTTDLTQGSRQSFVWRHGWLHSGVSEGWTERGIGRERRRKVRVRLVRTVCSSKGQNTYFKKKERRKLRYPKSKDGEKKKVYACSLQAWP